MKGLAQSSSVNHVHTGKKEQGNLSPSLDLSKSLNQSNCSDYHCFFFQYLHFSIFHNSIPGCQLPALTRRFTVYTLIGYTMLHAPWNYLTSHSHIYYICYLAPNFNVMSLTHQVSWIHSKVLSPNSNFGAGDPLLWWNACHLRGWSSDAC